MAHAISSALFTVLALGVASSTPPTNESEQPIARSCFSAAADPRGGVLVWGGARFCGVDVVADPLLWSWDGIRWKSDIGPPIEPRDDALLISDRNGGLTLLGGRHGGKAFTGVWVRERELWRSVPATHGPGPIQHGAAALDPERGMIVVFGGAVGTTTSSATHEWDGARWHTYQVPGPPPRVGHGMAWSEQDGGVLLYGGFSERGSFRDLWLWDGSGWSLLSEEGPTYTEGSVVAEAERGIYVVGPGLGSPPDPPHPTVRVWRWSARSFQAVGHVGDALPPLRIGAAAVYDRTRNVLVLFGGSDASGEPDPALWEFDGAQWRNRAEHGGETEGRR